MTGVIEILKRSTEDRDIADAVISIIRSLPEVTQFEIDERFAHLHQSSGGSFPWLEFTVVWGLVSFSVGISAAISNEPIKRLKHAGMTMAGVTIVSLMAAAFVFC